MGIFNRDKGDVPAPKGHEEVLIPISAPARAEVAIPENPNEVSMAKDTIEQLVNELKIGADQQNVAAKRMAGVAMTISKMESGLRHMSRLETHSVKLEDDLNVLRKRYAQKDDWANEQERKLLNLEKQHSELRKDLELARSELLARGDRETSHKETIGAQAAKLEGLSAIIAERDDRINTLSMTNLNLQEDVSAQSVTLSQQGNRILELTKSLEEVSARLEKKTKSNEQLMSDLSTLRLDHNELKSQYFEKLAALEHAQYDIKTQRSVLDEGLKRRDEEVYALNTRVEQLSAQVRIKENMSGHLDEEIISLRAALDSERARNERSEMRLSEKAEETSKTSAALVNTKADYDALSAKYNKVMHDLDATRRINQIQKQKLERYASIAALNASTPEGGQLQDGLKGGTGSRESYLSEYDTPRMSPKTPSNVDLPDLGLRDIPGRKKV